ncbi:MAG: transglycosylase SLT domain-containing protein [Bacteroidales bacterium]|nr:transglycosylase SLT domain-containing protein [Bacteroidales bacterium]
MKLRILGIVVLLSAMLYVPRAEAQESDAELMTQRYSESYDSLLNSYYMRRFAHHHLRSSSTFSVDEFDQLPDSVIESRMRALHTVVPMAINSEVRAHIRLYLRIMSRRLDLTLLQQERYFPIFQEALDRYGVPDEVKYLTIVESALNPEATSRVGAAGLWQFMYNTGRVYDLEVNSVLDERRDPVKASYAAARYLSDLHRVFDDWTLAIAAYNCGPGNINKAIARSGGKRDFWEIYYNLPRETRGYIPSLIAVIYVMNYYEQHGLRPSHLETPVRTDTVMLDCDVLLHYVARQTDLDIEALRQLNPQYRVDLIPASSGRLAITLPITKLEAFIRAQDSIYAWSADSLLRRPVKVAPAASKGATSHGGSGHYYTVRKGDTLSSIARKHGISVQTLKKRNGLKSDKIRVGQKLKV